MEDSLQRLEIWLGRHRPAMQAALRPGAAQAALEAHAVPAALQALWRWHDGQQMDGIDVWSGGTWAGPARQGAWHPARQGAWHLGWQRAWAGKVLGTGQADAP
jgi:cell wall assembly regulator SMI1